MVQFRFEKLEAWQFAITFCNEVYEVTKMFPDDERFGLTSQLRRAGTSIAANIAEGASRFSRRDNLRFVEIAYGSLMEVVSHVEISHRRNFIAVVQYESIRGFADELARMLSGLRNHLSKPNP